MIMGYSDELRTVDIEPTDIRIYYFERDCDGRRYYNYCGVWAKIFINDTQKIHKYYMFGDNEIDSATAKKYSEMLQNGKKFIVLGMLHDVIRKREGLREVAYPCGCGVHEGPMLDDNMWCHHCFNYADDTCLVYPNNMWEDRKQAVELTRLVKALK